MVYKTKYQTKLTFCNEGLLLGTLISQDYNVLAQVKKGKNLLWFTIQTHSYAKALFFELYQRQPKELASSHLHWVTAHDGLGCYWGCDSQTGHKFKNNSHPTKEVSKIKVLSSVQELMYLIINKIITCVYKFRIQQGLWGLRGRIGFNFRYVTSCLRRTIAFSLEIMSRNHIV